MKNHRSFFAPLLAVALLITSSGFLFAAEPIPENDYAKLENQIRKVEKDTFQITNLFCL